MERLHEWITCSTIGTFAFCKVCGVVRKRDSSNDRKPCRGPTKLSLRGRSVE